MRRGLQRKLDTLLIEAQRTGNDDAIVYLDEKTGNVWFYTAQRGEWFRSPQDFAFPWMNNN